MHDLALALRLLRKSPAFTSLAVLCLALGIGVNASIFSLLDAVYFRPLPVANAARIAVLSRDGRPFFSYAEYSALRDRNRSLDGLAISFPEESDLSFEGNAGLIGAEPISANYAAVLGVRPFMGRWFTREDEPAAVISYRAWQQLFHADPAALGKTIHSESHTYTVVGVAPPEFAGIYAPLRIDLWVPFHYWAGNDAGRRRGMIFAALKPGLAAAQSSAELTSIDTRFLRETMASSAPVAPLLLELVRGIPNPVGRRQATPAAILLMAVVALVLLIACMNVGNLLIARGMGRRREVAVRLALGASRARVLRQLITENLTLGLLGGAAGIFVTFVTNHLLRAALPLFPFGEAFRLDLSFDSRVLLYTASIAVGSAFFFGLLPALQSSRSDLAAVLKGANIAGGRLRLRLALLTGQIALSLVLLLTAGLFARLVLRFHSLDPGFASANRAYAPVFLPAPRFTPVSGRLFYTQLLDRLRAIPGVRSTALTTRLPLYAAGIAATCIAPEAGQSESATSMTVGRGFLDTLRIPLLEGRNFALTDIADGPPVAIVNQTLAHLLWPGQSAVGRMFQLGCDHPRTLQVVGVARDSRIRSLNEVTLPHVYRAFSQAYDGGIAYLIVETAADPGPVIEPLRRILTSAGPDFRTYGVHRLTESLDASFWQARFELWVVGVLGSLALLLAAVGLYGVLVCHVAARTREIGIRVALGAQPRKVVHLILVQGLRVTLLGVGAGLIVSALASRLLTSLLQGVSPADPVTWSSAVLIWIAVSLLACWLPARRATRVVPISALREE
ncbi:MAG: ABC transporter permease [Acidobacteriota bacterium]|nr:ABC transporter permease [Acidobacteriota bacterium]